MANNTLFKSLCDIVKNEVIEIVRSNKFITTFKKLSMDEMFEIGKFLYYWSDSLNDTEIGNETETVYIARVTKDQAKAYLEDSFDMILARYASTKNITVNINNLIKDNKESAIEIMLYLKR